MTGVLKYLIKGARLNAICSQWVIFLAVASEFNLKSANLDPVTTILIVLVAGISCNTYISAPAANPGCMMRQSVDITLKIHVYISLRRFVPVDWQDGRIRARRTRRKEGKTRISE